MEIKSTVTAIGPKALSDEDPMVILFDESASEALRQVAIIQQFGDPAHQEKLHVQSGDQLSIDGQHFKIHEVGSLVNENLRTIGHVTLIFSDKGPSDLQNALYFAEGTKPEFHVGTQIIYTTK
ncbi:PTS glucitol/sorbitol transporter subunit IIA [Lapidilactobacillus mulanensis]|uniref:PTS glucitol/sorbitol transporter subunit IIA n=1 Tax=Lapidilactobacillus mulanensis TaxID=2485999 RepID=A0ABW4DMB5_9LACO|nr:PTS glucitol/sorbitol transporter subunit IIA [Lapidilactobacillus mulanensis]